MPLSKQQVRRRIAELDSDPGWYQDIDVGDGMRTKSRVIWGEDPDHPRRRWEQIAGAIPGDLSGMSVLDIGCNAGYFAFQAKQRGARYVCGVDLKPGYIEQARFCAEAKDLDVDFRTLSIYHLARLDRQFDLVLCIGLLYHCKYLMTALEQVAAVARTTVIAESAIDPGDSDIPYVRFVRSSQYGGPDARGSRRLPGHWHPNMTALAELFREVGFSDVRPLFTDGGRGAVIATR